MMRIAYFILIIFICSCSGEVAKKLEPKGTALGKMNEIIVIADRDLWESAIGDTFKFYFGSAYPILPQPEPLFDVRHFTPEDLVDQPLRRGLRTYAILADLSDENSSTTQMVKRDMGEEKFNHSLKKGETTSSVGKDKWARGQLLIYLFGKDKAALAQSITQGFPAVTKRVYKHDRKQLAAANYTSGINLGLSRKIAENYHIQFDVPAEYDVAKRDSLNNFIWLRKDAPQATLSIVIQKLPYTNQSQLNKENIIAWRDKFGSTYVESDTPDDVMVVNGVDLPVYEYTTQIDGHFTRELRGTWEMTKQFMGGSFNTYAIVNEQRSELVFIDVFLLAPGKKKRNTMMQLDDIIKSVKVL